MKFRPFIERILHNWPIKILCLAISIILFLVYRISSLEERFFMVPLTVHSGSELVPASDWPRMVRISLRGEPNVVKGIFENDIEAWLDLHTIQKEGPASVPIRIVKTGSAAAVDPLEIHVEPEEVELNMEIREEKMVPVLPSFRGSIDSGYDLSNWTLAPSMVTITGPASRIARLQELSSEAVELGGRKGNFSLSLRVLNPDSLVKISGEGTVLLSAFIQEATLVRDFSNIVPEIIGLNAEFDAEMDPQIISFKLSGPWPRLQPWTIGNQAVYIDGTRIKRAGRYQLPIEFEIPAEFTIQDLSEDTLELEVKLSPQIKEEDE